MYTKKQKKCFKKTKTKFFCFVFLVLQPTGADQRGYNPAYRSFKNH